MSHEKAIESCNSGLNIRSGFHILSVPRITDQREDRVLISCFECKMINGKPGSNKSKKQKKIFHGSALNLPTYV